MQGVACRDFSLETTLSSGQAFRWRRQGEDFVGAVGGAMVRVRQQQDRLFYDSSDPDLTAEGVRRYFGLDVDLDAILRTIDVDTQIHAAITRYRGLRVLRQDGWETLASFICSSFNNMKRIEGMIERLAQTFGRPIALGRLRGFGFPDAQTVAAASARRLRSLGLGYRAEYLRATAKLVADGKLPLAQLKSVDYAAAKAALSACEGVGDKVADCVALFGLEKYEAFPIDVWMERVMRYYFRHRRMTRRRLHRYAQAHFGPYAGYAQQYLFHYARMGASVSAPAASFLDNPH